MLLEHLFHRLQSILIELFTLLATLVKRSIFRRYLHLQNTHFVIHVALCHPVKSWSSQICFFFQFCYQFYYYNITCEKDLKRLRCSPESKKFSMPFECRAKKRVRQDVFYLVYTIGTVKNQCVMNVMRKAAFGKRYKQVVECSRKAAIKRQ